MMARTVGSKNQKPQIDPLLAALIARLPRPGTNWPTKDRVAWLEMTERALDVVYPRDMTDIPDAHPQHNGHAAPSEPVYPQYIDREGFVRRAGGVRINYPEVDGRLYDLRGEGDLGSIKWADDSTGVLGKMLDIAAT